MLPGEGYRCEGRLRAENGHGRKGRKKKTEE
jgi:hypothetical protein